MKLEVNIEKRYFFALLFAGLVLIGVVGVVAEGGEVARDLIDHVDLLAGSFDLGEQLAELADDVRRHLDGVPILARAIALPDGQDKLRGLKVAGGASGAGRAGAGSGNRTRNVSLGSSRDTFSPYPRYCLIYARRAARSRTARGLKDALIGFPRCCCSRP